MPAWALDAGPGPGVCRHAACGMVAANNGTVIAAAWSGKIKTSCTMVGLMRYDGVYDLLRAGHGRDRS